MISGYTAVEKKLAMGKTKGLSLLLLGDEDRIYIFTCEDIIFEIFIGIYNMCNYLYHCMRTRDGSKALIGGFIFIYSGFARLILLKSTLFQKN